MVNICWVLLMFRSFSDAISYIKTKDIHCVNFCWFDIIGKRYSITLDASAVDEELLHNGVRHSSCDSFHCREDMILRPDIATAYTDLQCAYPALSMMCYVYDGHQESAFCGRGIVKKSSQTIIPQGLDSVAIAVGLEYFIFDDVRYAVDTRRIFSHIGSDEGVYACQRKKEYGNTGHRVGNSGGMFASQPRDTLFDLRVETAENLKKSGVDVTSHYHSESMGQCVINLNFDNLLTICDKINIAKYIINGTVASYGKTATFMPKPLCGVAGSGLHILIDISKTNVQAGSFVRGVLNSIVPLTALTNASTNSYKRLLDNMSPNHMVCDLSDKYAAIRAPYKIGDNNYISIRFPDVSMNAYIGLPAILSAGFSGGDIGNLKSCVHSNNRMSFNDSLAALSKYPSFISDILSAEQVSYYVAHKYTEIEMIESTPHPAEFVTSFGC